MIDPVFAYLDPGAGATLMQILLAGTAGVAAAAKLRMNAIKRRLGKDVDSPREQEREEDPSPVE